MGDSHDVEQEVLASPAMPAAAGPTVLGPLTDAQAVLAMQRGVGNAVVARVLAGRPEAGGRLQRGFRLFGVSVGEDDQLTVEEVLRRRDPDLIDNLPSARLTGASEGQKLELLGLLANRDGPATRTKG